MRPWLGLKMLDLNDVIVAQLKEKVVLFPDVTKGQRCSCAYGMLPFVVVIFL